MQPTVTLPLEGRTDWKTFWGVLGAGLVTVGCLTGLIMNGEIALAVTAVPTSFEVKADSINATSFSLTPGATPDHQNSAAVVNMDGKLSGMKIVKDVDVPVLNKTVELTISAGTDPNNPVNASGMTVYASSIGAGTATFSGLNMDASSGGLSLGQGGNMTLQGADLQVPYLNTNSITLPGMQLSVSIK